MHFICKARYVAEQSQSSTEDCRANKAVLKRVWSVGLGGVQPGKKNGRGKQVKKKRITKFSAQ